MTELFAYQIKLSELANVEGTVNQTRNLLTTPIEVNSPKTAILNLIYKNDDFKNKIRSWQNRYFISRY